MNLKRPENNNKREASEARRFFAKRRENWQNLLHIFLLFVHLVKSQLMVNEKNCYWHRKKIAVKINFLDISFISQRFLFLFSLRQNEGKKNLSKALFSPQKLSDKLLICLRSSKNEERKKIKQWESSRASENLPDRTETELHDTTWSFKACGWNI